MRKLVLLAVLLAFLVAPAAAMAEDLLPPWWRGMPGTTSQVWEFMDPTTNLPGVPILPDPLPPVGGEPWLPSTQVIVTPGPDMYWLEEHEGGIGVWPLSGWIDVVVDNFPEPNPEKWIQVQLTWLPQDQGVEPRLFEIFPEPSPQYPPTYVDAIASNGWNHRTYEWRLDHNPLDEWFTIDGSIYVDELVIDTWCVPEPSTIVSLIVLVMMAGFVFLRRGK